MAEGLAIASGIAGLLSLTIEVFGISYKYVNGVRDASSSAGQFLKELEALQKVLFSIEQSAKQTGQVEVFGDARSCFLSIEKSDEYVDLLEKVRGKLQQRQTPFSFRNKMKALTWPFSEKETLDLTESLHRHLNIYNTALAVDNRYLHGFASKCRIMDDLRVQDYWRTYIERGEKDQCLSGRQVGLNSPPTYIAHINADSRIKAVLDWLSPLNMHQKQQDTLSRRHGITSSWLLKDPVFEGWLDSECSQRTLWCPGDPGTGKTIITSVVIDHLLNNYASEDTKVAYVYCDYKDQDAQTASNLIACLARQIIGRPQELPQQLAELHSELKEQNGRPSFDELKRLLVALCNQYTPTYIVVDALDECKAHERRRLLPVLKSLEEAPTKLFVTSRPNNEDIFQSFGKAPQITVAAPESDLRRYIMERMDERRDFVKRLTPGLKEEITSTISAGASGMFLLAALQIDRIFATRTVKAIRSALTSMPGGLDELYRQTLERIQKQAGDDGTLGMRILSWITHARRPLSVNELLHGLAVEYSDDGEGLEDFDEDNLLSPGSLVDVCAGLVIIDSTGQIVRLVHYTTQKYFEEVCLYLFEGAEVDISRACLTYLSYDLDTKLSNGKIINVALHEYGDIFREACQSHPFLDYASHYWFSHVRSGLLAENANPVFLKAVAQFKSSDSILISTNLLYALSRKPICYLQRDLRSRDASPVEIASILGLEELVTVLLDPSTVTCPVSDQSLSFASDTGDLNIVKLLLQYGAQVNSTVRNDIGGTTTALGAACRRGHLSMAEFLIESGADINGNYSVDLPPLHNAVICDRTDIIDLLLKRDVNVNARNSGGQTACHIAARNERTDSAIRLLDAGCDLDLMNDDGMTALHYAAQDDHYEMIELLLGRGADASAKNKRGKTARNLLKRYLEESTYYSPEDRENVERIVERLRHLEQKSSTPTMNTSKDSEANSSKE